MATTTTTTTTTTPAPATSTPTTTTTEPRPLAPSTDTDQFPHIPPFPPTVPTAPLLRLSLAKLLSNDGTETAQLFRAAKELGFFYLDLRGVEIGESILGDVERLFGVGKEVFDLPREEKEGFDWSGEGSYFGYKGYGAGVIDKDGTRDRNEFYNVSKNDLLHLTSPPLPAPNPLLTTPPLLTSFIRTSHTILTLLLSHLSTHLLLPPSSESYLPNLHRLSALSGDQVRFVKAPPQPETDRRVALGAHSDFGSLTLLFNRLGGLQISLPGGMSAQGETGGEEGGKDAQRQEDGEKEGKKKEEDGQWVYVKPLPGHAIVNLGDAMVKFTNGLLRSCVHRVVNPPGEQAGETRYSVVYFMRAEDEVFLKRLDDGLDGGGVIPRGRDGGEGEGEGVTSREWVLRRALGRRTVKGGGNGGGGGSEQRGFEKGGWEASLGTEGVGKG